MDIDKALTLATEEDDELFELLTRDEAARSAVAELTKLNARAT